MQKEKIKCHELQLMGMAVRTNNRNEMNLETAKIPGILNAYWNNQLANEFKHRTNPGVTYCVYTEYESDEHGDYTYFVGEKVDSFHHQDTSKFKTLLIPSSTYQKFTTPTGQIPDIVIAAWQAIWQMNEKDFDGQRSYIADFEVYDQRANDFKNSVIDVYIGLKK